MDLDSLEATYSEAFGVFEELGDLEFIKEPDFRATAGGNYPALYNNVFCSRFAESDLDLVERVIPIFKKAKSSFYWRVWPSDTPSDLGERLIQKQFSLVGKNVILASDRPSLESLPLPAQPGICEKVTSLEQMNEWCQLFETGFQVSPRESLPFLRLFEKGTHRLTHFLIRYQQKVAGIMTSIPKDSYIGFYNGTVAPEFRRLGLFRQLFDHVQRNALTSPQFKTFYAEVRPDSYAELKRNTYKDICFTHHYRWDFKN